MLESFAADARYALRRLRHRPTMGIELLAGRALEDSDRVEGLGEGTVVINQALADKYFPGVDRIGRRIAFGSRVARTAAGHDAAAILTPVRRAIQSAAPGVALQETTTLENVLSRAIGPSLQVMSLLSLLGALALVLGTIGVYGVVSHFVNRRTREWGIHIALGLQPPAVAARIVKRGAGLLLAGIALGLAAFFALARLLASFLYGVAATDPGAIASATAILLMAGLLATVFPARRASRIDPAVVLREQ